MLHRSSDVTVVKSGGLIPCRSGRKKVEEEKKRRVDSL